jgi:hypothetical protein
MPMGSVAEAVMRRAKCPVLAVKAEVPPAVPSLPRVERFIFEDFSTSSRSLGVGNVTQEIDVPFGSS